MTSINTFYALLRVELTRLWRDKLSLLFLFLLPATLLVLLCFTRSHNSYHQTLTIRVINQDRGPIMSAWVNRLTQSNDGVHFIAEAKDTSTKTSSYLTSLELKTIAQRMRQGAYQAVLYIPPNTSEHIKQHYVKLFMFRLSDAFYRPDHIQLIVDPALRPEVSGAIMDGLRQAVAQIQLTTVHHALQRLIPTLKQQALTPLITMQTKSADSHAKLPSPAQQNVPAWILFGLFFSAIPVASGMIQQRQLGINTRLRMANVPAFMDLLSKVFLFLIITLIQAMLMLCIGVYLLPLLKLSSLTLHHQWFPCLMISACAALVAIGLGILMGRYAQTSQQVVILLPFLIIIGAAVGGVLIPTYRMSPALLAFANASPLYWAQQAFIDVLVYHQTLQHYGLYCLKLIALFIVFVCLAALPMADQTIRRE